MDHGWTGRGQTAEKIIEFIYLFLVPSLSKANLLFNAQEQNPFRYSWFLA